MLTPEQQEQLRQAKLARAYRDLLGALPVPGAPDTRSPAQIMVMADLEAAGYFRMNCFPVDKTGAMDPLAGAWRDGRRSLLLYIKSNVEFEPKLELG